MGLESHLGESLDLFSPPPPAGLPYEIESHPSPENSEASFHLQLWVLVCEVDMIVLMRSPSLPLLRRRKVGSLKFES